MKSKIIAASLFLSPIAYGLEYRPLIRCQGGAVVVDQVIGWKQHLEENPKTVLAHQMYPFQLVLHGRDLVNHFTAATTYKYNNGETGVVGVSTVGQGDDVFVTSTDVTVSGTTMTFTAHHINEGGTQLSTYRFYDCVVEAQPK